MKDANKKTLNKQIVLGLNLLLSATSIIALDKQTNFETETHSFKRYNFVDTFTHLSSSIEQSWGQWWKDLLEPFAKTATAKTWDQAINDPEFYRAVAYTGLVDGVEDYNEGNITKERFEQTLQNARNDVSNGTIGLSAYLDTLKDVKDVTPELLQQEYVASIEALKENKELLNQIVIDDLSYIGQHKKDSKTFAKALGFYQSLQTPLDHLVSLHTFGQLISENTTNTKLSSIRVKKLSNAIIRHVDALNKKNPEYMLQAIEQRHQMTQWELEADENARGSSHEISVEHKTYSEQFRDIAYTGGKFVYEGIKYAVKHPIETTTMLLAAQVAGAAAINPVNNLVKRGGGSSQILSTTFGSATISDASVASFTTDSQNRFLVTWSPSAGGVVGQVYYPNATAYGPQITINSNTASGNPISGPGMSNGLIPVGYTGSDNNYYVNYVTLGNPSTINPSVKLSQTSGSVSNLMFTPLQGSNNTFPTNSIFASWNAPNGYGVTTFVFPNGTTTGEQLLGNVATAISSNINANLEVFLQNSNTDSIAGSQLTWNNSSYSGGYTTSNGTPNICGNSYEYGSVAQMPNKNILLGCTVNGQAPILAIQLSPNGTSIGKIQTVTSLSATLNFNIALPDGNALFYSLQNNTGTYGFARFTANGGQTWGPEVNIGAAGTGYYGAYVGGNKIATVSGNTLYIVPESVINPSSGTTSTTSSSSTSTPTTSSTTSTTATPTSTTSSTVAGTTTTSTTSSTTVAPTTTSTTSSSTSTPTTSSTTSTTVAPTSTTSSTVAGTTTTSTTSSTTAAPTTTSTTSSSTSTPTTSSTTSTTATPTSTTSSTVAGTTTTAATSSTTVAPTTTSTTSSSTSTPTTSSTTSTTVAPTSTTSSTVAGTTTTSTTSSTTAAPTTTSTTSSSTSTPTTSSTTSTTATPTSTTSSTVAGTTTTAATSSTTVAPTTTSTTSSSTSTPTTSSTTSTTVAPTSTTSSTVAGTTTTAATISSTASSATDGAITSTLSSTLGTTTQSSTTNPVGNTTAGTTTHNSTVMPTNSSSTHNSVVSSASSLQAPAFIRWPHILATNLISGFKNLLGD